MNASITSGKESKGARIIINADDFGISRGVNDAIHQLVDHGMLNSTSVMTNMPYYEDIKQLQNRLGVGIHFNLTTGIPVVKPKLIPSLVRSNGEFIDLKLLMQKMKRGTLVPYEVECELDAQVRRLLVMGIRPDHVDSHESLIKYLFFRKIIMRIAKKYEISGVRTYQRREFEFSRLMSPRKSLISLYLWYQRYVWKRNGFRVADMYDSLIKKNLDTREASEKLKHIFQSLSEGVIEIGVHPGYVNGNTLSLGEYVQEREAELQALMNTDVKESFVSSGCRLISYGEIA